MPTEVINTVSLTKNPEFKNVKTINKNFKNIKKEHCNSLLEFLYNGGLGKWQNPFTKKFLSRESPIIISFLSRCYNMSDDSKINIHGCNLTYKKHIDKFINNEYLYVPFKKKSTNSKKSNVNTQSVHEGVSHRNSRRNSLRSNQVRRRNNSTIDTGSSLHFNYGGTWQPNLVQQPPFTHPIAQTFTQPIAQPFVQPIVNSSYTYQPPYHQPSHNQTYLPRLSHISIQPSLLHISANNPKINKEDGEDYYYEHKLSNKRWYKRNIPNYIWYLISKLGSNYIGSKKGEIIDKMNNKYTDDQEIFEIWKKEEKTEPDKVKRERDLYKRMEDDDISYFFHQIFRGESNGKKILNARKSWFRFR